MGAALKTGVELCPSGQGYLVRDEDVSGVSALGNDAEVVKSSSGKAVVAWRMPKVTIDVQDTLEIIGRM